MSWRDLAKSDAGDALPLIWQVLAGLALLVMLGNWVHRVRPRTLDYVHVTVPADSYAIDAATGAVSVPVVIRSEHDIMLAGCPETPALVVQLWAGEHWNDHSQLNRPCARSRAGATVVRLFEHDSITSSVAVTVPGRYRVGLAVPWYGRVRWVPGETFTVRR